MRRAARIILTVLLVLSVSFSCINLYLLASAWPGSLLVAASRERIEAAVERALAREATAKAIESRLKVLLSEHPRTWLAIDALVDLAGDRGIVLSEETAGEIEAARDQDSGFWVSAGACGNCLLDATTCSVAMLLACRAPVELTPIGDVAGLIRAATAYVSGQEIDILDAGLSALGLGATALALATGGSSLAIKGGAGLMKLAKVSNRLPAGVQRQLTRILREGFDWAGLAKIRGTDDIASLARMDVLAPAMRALGDAKVLDDAAGVTGALYLVSKTDSLDDIHRLSRVANAAGPRTVGTMELLGKRRLLRLAMRWSDELWQVIAGILAACATLAGLVLSFIGNRVLKALRRMAKPPPQST